MDLTRNRRSLQAIKDLEIGVGSLVLNCLLDSICWSCEGLLFRSSLPDFFMVVMDKWILNNSCYGRIEYEKPVPLSLSLLVLYKCLENQRERLDCTVYILFYILRPDNLLQMIANCPLVSLFCVTSLFIIRVYIYTVLTSTLIMSDQTLLLPTLLTSLPYVSLPSPSNPPGHSPLLSGLFSHLPVAQVKVCHKQTGRCQGVLLIR